MSNAKAQAAWILSRIAYFFGRDELSNKFEAYYWKQMRR